MPGRPGLLQDGPAAEDYGVTSNERCIESIALPVLCYHHVCGSWYVERRLARLA